MKQKTSQNYKFFAPTKHNHTFNMSWHFVACENGNWNRSNLYFRSVPNPLDEKRCSIAVTFLPQDIAKLKIE